MELWPAEYEEFRKEAVEVATAAVEFRARFVPEDLPADPAARVAIQRQLIDAMAQPSEQAEEREIAGVPCRVFLPEGTPSGIYLHFHGGGMIMGRPQMNDLGNEALCDRLGLAVVSVDYRLAPEHPHPAGPDDGLAVARWLVEEGESALGSSRLVVGGESAGGFMAAITLLRVRDELGAVDRFVGANLVFGVYDWGRSPSQRGIRTSEAPDILDPDGIEFFTDCYLPGMTDDERRAPDISPAFADLRNLPPALFTVGSGDHLLDDTLWLATRWRAAGNEAELAVYPDCVHGFQAHPTELSRRAMARIDAWFDAVVTSAPAR